MTLVSQPDSLGVSRLIDPPNASQRVEALALLLGAPPVNETDLCVPSCCRKSKELARSMTEQPGNPDRGQQAQQYQCSESILVVAPAPQLYAMLADVTRMAEWSPVPSTNWWEDDTGPRVGAWFVGRNVKPDKIFVSRCQVVAADEGSHFGFIVGEVNYFYLSDEVRVLAGDEQPVSDSGTIEPIRRVGPFVRWDYRLTPNGQETEVTESMTFLPTGIERFHERWGDEVEEVLEGRVAEARSNIRTTLSVLKMAVEIDTHMRPEKWVAEVARPRG